MSHSTHSPSVSQTSARVSAWVMIVIGAGSVLSSLDLFVVNLAFPAIRDSFAGATNQALSWVISAYSIAFAAFLVPAGRMADIYGRKRIFKAGLAVFSVASVACAFAPDVISLICARGLKGVGAAMMIPTSLGLLLAAYPKERHKPMVGIWAATGSVAAALGPMLGGALVNIDWRLIFLINLPVAIPALWLSKHLTETEVVKSRFPDIIGSLMLVVGLALLVAGISWASDWGLTSAQTLDGAGRGVRLPDAVRSSLPDPACPGARSAGISRACVYPRHAGHGLFLHGICHHAAGREPVSDPGLALASRRGGCCFWPRPPAPPWSPR
ncbi:Spectinomycin tetracycline efflux pump [Cedecea neteri]|uniref:Spectinomycin tetracycline efflux pump n=1 Tax=Cedecea neteri TaxID=158822 RepID=A0A2X2TKA9_9ENTR|nr:Spectinomycin tetracycline efflux pump [Cedecea neteri]